MVEWNPLSLFHLRGTINAFISGDASVSANDLAVEISKEHRLRNPFFTPSYLKDEVPSSPFANDHEKAVAIEVSKTLKLSINVAQVYTRFILNNSNFSSLRDVQENFPELIPASLIKYVYKGTRSVQKDTELAIRVWLFDRDQALSCLELMLNPEYASNLDLIYINYSYLLNHTTSDDTSSYQMSVVGHLLDGITEITSSFTSGERNDTFRQALAVSHQIRAARLLLSIFAVTQISFDGRGNIAIDGYAEFCGVPEAANVTSNMSESTCGGEFLHLLKTIHVVSEALWDSPEHGDSSPLWQVSYTLCLSLLMALDYQDPKVDPDLRYMNRFSRFLSTSILVAFNDHSHPFSRLVSKLQSMELLPGGSGNQATFWRHTPMKGLLLYSLTHFFHSVFRFYLSTDDDTASLHAFETDDLSQVPLTFKSISILGINASTDKSSAPTYLSRSSISRASAHARSSEVLVPLAQFVLESLLRASIDFPAKAFTSLSRVLSSDSFLNLPPSISRLAVPLLEHSVAEFVRLNSSGSILTQNAADATASSIWRTRALLLDCTPALQTLLPPQSLPDCIEDLVDVLVLLLRRDPPFAARFLCLYGAHPSSGGIISPFENKAHFYAPSGRLVPDSDALKGGLGRRTTSIFSSLSDSPVAAAEDSSTIVYTFDEGVNIGCGAASGGLELDPFFFLRRLLALMKDAVAFALAALNNDSMEGSLARTDMEMAVQRHSMLSRLSSDSFFSDNQGSGPRSGSGRGAYGFKDQLLVYTRCVDADEDIPVGGRARALMKSARAAISQLIYLLAALSQSGVLCADGVSCSYKVFQLLGGLGGPLHAAESYVSRSVDDDLPLLETSSAVSAVASRDSGSAVAETAFFATLDTLLQALLNVATEMDPVLTQKRKLRHEQLVANYEHTRRSRQQDPMSYLYSSGGFGGAVLRSSGRGGHDLSVMDADFDAARPEIPRTRTAVKKVLLPILQLLQNMMADPGLRDPLLSHPSFLGMRSMCVLPHSSAFGGEGQAKSLQLAGPNMSMNSAADAVEVSDLNGQFLFYDAFFNTLAAIQGLQQQNSGQNQGDLASHNHLSHLNPSWQQQQQIVNTLDIYGNPYSALYAAESTRAAAPRLPLLLTLIHLLRVVPLLSNEVDASGLMSQLLLVLRAGAASETLSPIIMHAVDRLQLISRYSSSSSSPGSLAPFKSSSNGGLLELEVAAGNVNVVHSLPALIFELAAPRAHEDVQRRARRTRILQQIGSGGAIAPFFHFLVQQVLVPSRGWLSLLQRSSQSKTNVHGSSRAVLSRMLTAQLVGTLETPLKLLLHTINGFMPMDTSPTVTAIVDFYNSLAGALPTPSSVMETPLYVVPSITSSTASGEARGNDGSMYLYCVEVPTVSTAAGTLQQLSEILHVPVAGSAPAMQGPVQSSAQLLQGLEPVIKLACPASVISFASAVPGTRFLAHADSPALLLFSSSVNSDELAKASGTDGASSSKASTNLSSVTAVGASILTNRLWIESRVPLLDLLHIAALDAHEPSMGSYHMGSADSLALNRPSAVKRLNQLGLAVLSENVVPLTLYNRELINGFEPGQPLFDFYAELPPLSVAQSHTFSQTQAQSHLGLQSHTPLVSAAPGAQPSGKRAPRSVGFGLFVDILSGGDILQTLLAYLSEFSEFVDEIERAETPSDASGAHRDFLGDLNAYKSVKQALAFNRSLDDVSTHESVFYVSSSNVLAGSGTVSLYHPAPLASEGFSAPRRTHTLSPALAVTAEEDAARDARARVSYVVRQNLSLLPPPSPVDEGDGLCVSSVTQHGLRTRVLTLILAILDAALDRADAVLQLILRRLQWTQPLLALRLRLAPLTPLLLRLCSVQSHAPLASLAARVLSRVVTSPSPSSSLLALPATPFSSSSTEVIRQVVVARNQVSYLVTGDASCTDEAVFAASVRACAAAGARRRDALVRALAHNMRHSSTATSDINAQNNLNPFVMRYSESDLALLTQPALTDADTAFCSVLLDPFGLYAPGPAAPGSQSAPLLVDSTAESPLSPLQAKLSFLSLLKNLVESSSEGTAGALLSASLGGLPLLQLLGFSYPSQSQTVPGQSSGYLGAKLVLEAPTTRTPLRELLLDIISPTHISESPSLAAAQLELLLALLRTPELLRPLLSYISALCEMSFAAELLDSDSHFGSLFALLLARLPAPVGMPLFNAAELATISTSPSESDDVSTKSEASKYDSRVFRAFCSLLNEDVPVPSACQPGFDGSTLFNTIGSTSDLLPAHIAHASAVARVRALLMQAVTLELAHHASVAANPGSADPENVVLARTKLSEIMGQLTAGERGFFSRVLTPSEILGLPALAGPVSAAAASEDVLRDQQLLLFPVLPPLISSNHSLFIVESSDFMDSDSKANSGSPAAPAAPRMLSIPRLTRFLNNYVSVHPQGSVSRAAPLLLSLALRHNSALLLRNTARMHASLLSSLVSLVALHCLPDPNPAVVASFYGVSLPGQLSGPAPSKDLVVEKKESIFSAQNIFYGKSAPLAASSSVVGNAGPNGSVAGAVQHEKLLVSSSFLFEFIAAIVHACANCGAATAANGLDAAPGLLEAALVLLGHTLHRMLPSCVPSKFLARHLLLSVGQLLNLPARHHAFIVQRLDALHAALAAQFLDCQMPYSVGAVPSSTTTLGLAGSSLTVGTVGGDSITLNSSPQLPRFQNASLNLLSQLLALAAVHTNPYRDSVVPFSTVSQPEFKFYGGFSAVVNHLVFHPGAEQLSGAFDGFFEALEVLGDDLLLQLVSITLSDSDSGRDELKSAALRLLRQLVRLPPSGTPPEAQFACDIAAGPENEAVTTVADDVTPVTRAEARRTRARIVARILSSGAAGVLLQALRRMDASPLVSSLNASLLDTAGTALVGANAGADPRHEGLSRLSRSLLLVDDSSVSNNSNDLSNNIGKGGNEGDSVLLQQWLGAGENAFSSTAALLADIISQMPLAAVASGATAKASVTVMVDDALLLLSRLEALPRAAAVLFVILQRHSSGHPMESNSLFHVAHVNNSNNLSGSSKNSRSNNFFVIPQSIFTLFDSTLRILSSAMLLRPQNEHVAASVASVLLRMKPLIDALLQASRFASLSPLVLLLSRNLMHTLGLLARFDGVLDNALCSANSLQIAFSNESSAVTGEGSIRLAFLADSLAVSLFKSLSCSPRLLGAASGVGTSSTAGMVTNSNSSGVSNWMNHITRNILSSAVGAVTSSSNHTSASVEGADLGATTALTPLFASENYRLHAGESLLLAVVTYMRCRAHAGAAGQASVASVPAKRPNGLIFVSAAVLPPLSSSSGGVLSITVLWDAIEQAARAHAYLCERIEALGPDAVDPLKSKTHGAAAQLLIRDAALQLRLFENLLVIWLDHALADPSLRSLPRSEIQAFMEFAPVSRILQKSPFSNFVFNKLCKF